MNIVFTCGRFSPPHVGHLQLIRRVAERAEHLGAEARVYATKSYDEKNPLEFEDKVMFMEAGFSDLVRVMDKPSLKPYDTVRDCLFDANGGEVVWMAGSDRVSEYEKLAKSILEKYQSRGELQGTTISVIEAMGRDDAEAYSASQMRKAVVNNDYKEFADHCPFEDKELIQLMFDKTKEGLKKFKLMENIMKGNPDEVYKTALNIIETIQNEGDKCYFIGGCVRDKLLGKAPNDYDMVTTMYFKTVAELFGTNDIRFRATHKIVVPVVDGEEFEIACLGKGEEIAKDLPSRDLTMNAMAYDPINEDLIDPCGGEDDMRNEVLNFTDYMKTHISNGKQPVAFLRAIRFYSTFGWEFTDDSYETLENFCKATNNKLDVSDKQFEKEWFKFEKGKNADKAMMLLDDLGLLDYIKEKYGI